MIRIRDMENLRRYSWVFIAAGHVIVDVRAEQRGCAFLVAQIVSDAVRHAFFCCTVCRHASKTFSFRERGTGSLYTRWRELCAKNGTW